MHKDIIYDVYSYFRNNQNVECYSTSYRVYFILNQLHIKNIVIHHMGPV